MKSGYNVVTVLLKAANSGHGVYISGVKDDPGALYLEVRLRGRKKYCNGIIFVNKNGALLHGDRVLVETLDELIGDVTRQENEASRG